MTVRGKASQWGRKERGSGRDVRKAAEAWTMIVSAMRPSAPTLRESCQLYRITSRIGLAMFELRTRCVRRAGKSAPPNLLDNARANALDLCERRAKLLNVDDDELVCVLDAVVEVPERVKGRSVEVVFVDFLCQAGAVGDGCDEPSVSAKLEQREEGEWNAPSLL